MIFPVACEEYKGVTRMCRDEIKKAKAQSEVNLARDAKNNKNGFDRCISQKNKTKESVHTDKQDGKTVDSRHGESRGTQHCLCLSLHWQ